MTYTLDCDILTKIFSVLALIGRFIMDLFDKCKNYTLPDELIKKGIYPYFHALQTKQDTEVVMEGTNVIMLGSNNYLGLTSHPDVIEAGKNAILKYGSGCSGSRFL